MLDVVANDRGWGYFAMKKGRKIKEALNLQRKLEFYGFYNCMESEILKSNIE